MDLGGGAPDPVFVDVVAVLRMLRFIGGPAASAVGTPTTDRNTVCRMMVRRRRGMFWVCGFVCSGDNGSRSWPDGLYDARFCLLGASRALPASDAMEIAIAEESSSQLFSAELQSRLFKRSTLSWPSSFSLRSTVAGNELK